LTQVAYWVSVLRHLLPLLPLLPPHLLLLRVRLTSWLNKVVSRQ
jgi:hypothetical protein